jgi:predicted nuclease of restriction endonuclease-like (RecB) superfamily
MYVHKEIFNVATKRKKLAGSIEPTYNAVLADVVGLVDAARHAAVRSTNAVMTATYWAIGRRIVEHEQHGAERAGYGEELIVRLSGDLQSRFGRGFGRANLFQMRSFYLAYRDILQTASGESGPDSLKVQTLSGLSVDSNIVASITTCFPLPWSHYVRLLAVRNRNAREFYAAEALRGGWTIRQLNRQIESQFYERTALSKDKPKMLRRGVAQHPADVVTPEQEIKDPYFLEFLALKDEYSETDLESALIMKLETFLLELGGDFTFVGRQRRLRVGDAWYRVDLLFFHRRLRCLIVVDLKLGKFTHADAGQMHLYLNYAREHWVFPGELKLGLSRQH